MPHPSWLRRHPLLGYFTLAYGISWGCILIVLGCSGFDLKVLRPWDTGLIFVAMLAGPSAAGLAMTALLSGSPGLRALRSSLALWRVGIRWYAVALLTAPTLLAAVLWTFAAFVDPADAPRFHWPMFAVGLVAGSFEEIGWTGFATPRLLARRGLLGAGLGLGLLWATWHVWVDFRQNVGAMGFAWLLDFVVFYLATLTAYRLLMTWLYANTRSLLLAVLMHASYTGWLFVLYPTVSSRQALAWQTAFAATLWAAAALALLGSSTVRRASAGATGSTASSSSSQRARRGSN